MLTLEAADLIEGDASASTVVDFTINGVQEASNVVSIKALADGQLPNTIGALYTTPGATTAIIKSITLVNTDSSIRTVNLYVQRDGSNSRRIIPEDLGLEANGGSVVVSDAIYLYDSAGQLKTVATTGTHEMLDGTQHADSVADAVTRGSIIYGNSTPKWDELDLSGADTFLGSDGTDLSYRTAAQVRTSINVANGAIAALVSDSTPALGGNLDMNEKGIKSTHDLDTDGKWEGKFEDGVLGETVIFGQTVYLKTADQRWWKTNATGEATSGDVMIGIVLEPGDAGESKKIGKCVHIREDDWDFTSFGQAIFLDEDTNGGMIQTAPAGSGEIVRVVGYADTNANVIYFEPDNMWLELA